MFNVNLVTAKMKLQVESQDGSVLVAQVPVVTTLGAGPTALRHQPDNQETRTGVDNLPSECWGSGRGCVLRQIPKRIYIAKLIKIQQNHDIF